MNISTTKTITFTLTLSSQELVMLNARGTQKLEIDSECMPELDGVNKICFEVKSDGSMRHDFIITEAAKAIYKRRSQEGQTHFYDTNPDYTNIKP